MKPRPLGRTGVKVPPLCLGTMTFGMQCDEATSFAIMDKAYESGIDFFDTADGYPLGGGAERVGLTEEIIGRWMKDRGVRDRIFLATKCRAPMGPTINDSGLSRYNIQRAVERSLKRLQTDVIDLYQAHSLDRDTPAEETLRAFDDLVRAGKVRYVGCSNYPAWRLADALGISERQGLSAFQTLQPRYNLLYREIETEVLPLCRDKGLGVIVYNPVAGGMLSGRYRRGQNVDPGSRFNLPIAGTTYQQRYWHDTHLAAVEGLTETVRAAGQEMAAVAVAWVLRQPGITSAIIGASRPGHLDATRKGADLVLTDEVAAACDAVWWTLPRTPVTEGYR
jgi:aryl-alcohol dehydrogenase-like predicted oxidoreductase